MWLYVFYYSSGILLLSDFRFEYIAIYQLYRARARARSRASPKARTRTRGKG